MRYISREQLSIILEVMSFFFVTTDLYGSERLERLRDRLIENKDTPSKDKLSRPAKIFLVAGALGGLYYLGKAPFMDLFHTITHNNYSHYSFLDWLLLFTVGVVLIVLFVVFFSMIFMYLGAIAAAPFSFVPNLMIWILQQILKVVSLEGLLIGIGTCTFLLSKFLSFWKSD